MRPPVFTWIGGHDRTWLRGDRIAGLTVWAVLVPAAFAYASIARLRHAPGALLRERRRGAGASPAALEQDTKAVVLDAETVPFVDVTAVGRYPTVRDAVEALRGSTG